MPWITRKSELHEHDWRLLDFSPQPNEGFKISRPSEPPQLADTSSLGPNNGPIPQPKRQFLTCDDDVRQWLDSIYPWSPDTKVSSINLVMASKTESLDELPFSRMGFENIINKLNVHGSIVRAINRNTSCAFIHIPFTWNPATTAIPSIAKLPSQTRLHALQEVGARLKTRLQDLVDEYDEYIRQCTHIMDGLTLATQLELNSIGRKDARINQEISRVNLEVAQMTRLDGSLMKSIAMLGMVFLPATFVSTFFSMGFFQWTKEDGEGSEMLSPYFWVYVVVAVGLTIFTMLIFYACTLRGNLHVADSDQELA
ncbi:hypothetical protein FGADI_13174 [Fusarium gaditjirri]|uniref:Uncharacterized protein n=1 Tax=Fusarium gaditjirri TaxID=282569 RepID=A0A8H4SQA9_9HYPO|nr:hypothetical protein FGADI_13174 [Fusarium gaditjirri]